MPDANPLAKDLACVQLLAVVDEDSGAVRFRVVGCRCPTADGYYHATAAEAVSCARRIVAARRAARQWARVSR